MHAIEEGSGCSHTGAEHDGTLLVDHGIYLSHLGIIDSMLVGNRYHTDGCAYREPSKVRLHHPELHIHLLLRDDAAHGIPRLSQLTGMSRDICHDTVEGCCHAGSLQLVASCRQLVLGDQQATLDLGNVTHTLWHVVHLLGIVSL